MRVGETAGLRRGSRLPWVLGIIAGVILVAGLAAVILTARVARSLEGDLARLRKAGQPTTLAELNKPPVPAAENAALLYEQAAEDGKRAKTEFSDPYTKLTDPWSELQPAAARAAWRQLQGVRRHAEAAEVVRQAARRPQCNFGTDYRLGPDTTFPYLAIMRNSALLLGCTALDRAHGGDLSGGYGDAAAMLQVARHLQGEPTLTGLLVQYAVVAHAKRVLAVLGRHGPPSPAQARLLWPLLDDRDYQPDLVHMAAAERVCVLDVMERTRRDQEYLQRTMGEPASAKREPAGWLGCLIIDLDERHVIRTLDEAIAILAKEGPFSRVTADRLDDLALNSHPYAVLSSHLMPAFAQSYRACYRCRSYLAITRWGLAVELYRGETGHYPATLDEAARLAPADPGMDPCTGKRPVYRPTPRGYVLYSLGPNCQDNGGREHPPEGSSQSNWEIDDICWRRP